MNKTKRSEVFVLDSVIVSIIGPLKDEVLFEGKLFIIEEGHGPEIEWHPLKLKSTETRNSPDTENSDWEDVSSSSVGYKATHNDSLDAVQINAVHVPNIIKFDIYDLKSFKKSEESEGTRTVVTFLMKDGTNIPSFHFENSDFGNLCANLDKYIRFQRSAKESNLYLVVDSTVEKALQLEKSFSDLDIFSDSKTHVITKFFQDPLQSTFDLTKKIYEFTVSGYEREPAVGLCDSDLSALSDSIINFNIDHHEEPGFELITCIELPPRPDIKREDPVTLEEWNTYVDAEGKITNVRALKKRIFKGGLVHSLRSEAWKYLLRFYNFDDSHKDKLVIKKKKGEDYFRMKLQWKSFTVDQESRFSALRERKSIIDKDVSRTDRTHPFYEGENNPNIQMLRDILTTYCMYNFDLGYVQGMSDLLSPILVVMQDELEAFWCFAGWLETIGNNFELDQLGIKNQLQDLHRLLHFVDSTLCNYLEKHDSGNLYFAFRWLLILFKREFKFMEIMRLWEVLWTGVPCKNFHLLICIAILDTEKTTIMENQYGLSEILKHVNEMSYKINLDVTLAKAEAIYHQIVNSHYQSDVVQTILGIKRSIPPPDPIVHTSLTKPIRPPGFAVPVTKNENKSSFSNSSDEYVDVDRQYSIDFSLFN